MSEINEKVFVVEPMTLGQYYKENGWSLTLDVDPRAEGYKIEKADGYSTWMEAEEFHDHYDIKNVGRIKDDGLYW